MLSVAVSWEIPSLNESREGRYFMKKLFCGLHDQFEMINNILSIWSVGSCGGRVRDLISWWLQSWHALRQRVSVLRRPSSFEMQAVLLRRSFDFAGWFLLEEREREREVSFSEIYSCLCWLHGMGAQHLHNLRLKSVCFVVPRGENFRIGSLHDLLSISDSMPSWTCQSQTASKWRIKEKFPSSLSWFPLRALFLLSTAMEFSCVSFVLDCETNSISLQTCFEIIPSSRSVFPLQLLRLLLLLLFLLLIAQVGCRRVQGEHIAKKRWLLKWRPHKLFR